MNHDGHIMPIMTLTLKLQRDEPTLDNNNNITGFPAHNKNSILFEFKQKRQVKHETVAQKMLK